MARNDKIPIEPGLPRSYTEPIPWLHALTARLFSLLRLMIDQVNVMLDGWLLVLASLPAADAQQRGRLVIIRGGAGVTDTLYVCMKSAADTYSWRTIVTGG